MHNILADIVIWRLRLSVYQDSRVWYKYSHIQMAGLKKQEEYNWKDSNLALFGSDVEKQVKLESAQSEPAWENSG